jgi:hypothetical protein
MHGEAYSVVGLDEGIVDGDNMNIVMLNTVRCQLALISSPTSYSQPSLRSHL